MGAPGLYVVFMGRDLPFASRQRKSIICHETGAGP
jgi:hypothetical protein